MKNIYVGKSDIHERGLFTTDGLKEGDKVITSNYDDFKNVEVVNL